MFADGTWDELTSGIIALSRARIGLDEREWCADWHASSTGCYTSTALLLEASEAISRPTLILYLSLNITSCCIRCNRTSLWPLFYLIRHEAGFIYGGQAVVLLLWSGIIALALAVYFHALAHSKCLYPHIQPSISFIVSIDLCSSTYVTNSSNISSIHISQILQY